MQLFSQSSFLQALAYGLIASIWQLGLLWLVVIALLKSFKFSAAQKFNIAFTAQLSGFILFVYTCVNAYASGAGKIMINAGGSGLVTGIDAVINMVMPYVAAIYLGLLLYKLVKLSFVFGNTLDLKKHNLKKIAAEQRLFVQEYSQLFSIHKKVRIYLSEKVLSPLTTGFLKPVILIPVAAVNHLTAKQMEAVILHELAHIKRADYLLYVLQSFIEKIFFFNIFSLMLGEIIEKERENACDDWVLQFRYNSMHYAEALFKLGRLKAMPAMAMPLQGKKESLLLIRIKRLLHNPQRETINFQPVLLGLLSLMICAGLLIAPSPAKTNKVISVMAPTVNKVAPENTVTRDVAIADKNDNKREQVSPEKDMMLQLKPVEAKPEQPPLKLEKVQDKVDNDVARQLALREREQALTLQQNYLYNVRQSIDSLQQAMPQITAAVAANVQLNQEMLQKVVSYQNFKQLEAMIAASGDSINVKESNATIGSYKKLITIESFDKDGNKHVYSVVVELYQ